MAYEQRLRELSLLSLGEAKVVVFYDLWSGTKEESQSK